MWEHVAETAVSASFCRSFQKYIEAPHARLKTRFSQFLRCIGNHRNVDGLSMVLSANLHHLMKSTYLKCIKLILPLRGRNKKQLPSQHFEIIFPILSHIVGSRRSNISINPSAKSLPKLPPLSPRYPLRPRNRSKQCSLGVCTARDRNLGKPSGGSVVVSQSPLNLFSSSSKAEFSSSIASSSHCVPKCTNEVLSANKRQHDFEAISCNQPTLKLYPKSWTHLVALSKPSFASRALLLLLPSRCPLQLFKGGVRCFRRRLGTHSVGFQQLPAKSIFFLGGRGPILTNSYKLPVFILFPKTSNTWDTVFGFAAPTPQRMNTSISARLRSHGGFPIGKLLLNQPTQRRAAASLSSFSECIHQSAISNDRRTHLSWQGTVFADRCGFPLRSQFIKWWIAIPLDPNTCWLQYRGELVRGCSWYTLSSHCRCAHLCQEFLCFFPIRFLREGFHQSLISKRHGQWPKSLWNSIFGWPVMGTSTLMRSSWQPGVVGEAVHFQSPWICVLAVPKNRFPFKL